MAPTTRSPTTPATTTAAGSPSRRAPPGTTRPTPRATPRATAPTTRPATTAAATARTTASALDRGLVAGGCGCGPSADGELLELAPRGPQTPEHPRRGE